MIPSRFVSIRCGRENLRTMIRKIFLRVTLLIKRFPQDMHAYTVWLML